MSTNDLATKYNLPIPAIEKKWRELVKFGSVAVPTVLVLALLSPFLKSAFMGGAYLLGLGLLGGAAFTIGAFAIVLAPAVKKQFEIWAYQLSNWQTENYPMERLGIYYEFFRQKWQRTKDLRAKLGGRLKVVNDDIKKHQDTIDDAAQTLRDSRANLSQEAMEELEDRVLHAQQSKAEFEKFVVKLKTVLEAVGMLEDLNRKAFRKFKQNMRKMKIMKDVGDLMNELNTELRDLLGESPEQADAEAAMRFIEDSMGREFGVFEVLELQAKHLVARMEVDDEISLAQARQVMLERMRTIDADVKELAVDSVAPARSRLLDH